MKQKLKMNICGHLYKVITTDKQIIISMIGNNYDCIIEPMSKYYDGKFKYLYDFVENLIKTEGK